MLTKRTLITSVSALLLLSLATAGSVAAFSHGMFAPVSGRQAAQTAVAAIGSGYAKDIDFEYDFHTGSRYEVDVLHQGMKYEVLVSADDGKVLAVEAKRSKKQQLHDHGQQQQNQTPTL